MILEYLVSKMELYNSNITITYLESFKYSLTILVTNMVIDNTCSA